MMTEHEWIETLFARFPRSPRQLNQRFECDAELIQVGDEIWAVTTDDFSPEEDQFTDTDPATLGANLAVATLSDLYAAGADPCFLLHAVTLPHSCSAAFAGSLCDGIAWVLEAAGCHLLGGDLSAGDTWRYGGTAMGVVRGRPVTRRFTRDSRLLWVTGTLGDANLAAFTGEATPAFELRRAEAALMRQCATACIDTSGGLFDALWTLATLNPAWRMEIRLPDLPLAPGIRPIAAKAGIPALTAVTGGAGEYELLFATPADLDDTLRLGLERHRCTPVGVLSHGDAAPGLYVTTDAPSAIRIDSAPPCPRAAISRDEYLRQIMEYTRQGLEAPRAASRHEVPREP